MDHSMLLLNFYYFNVKLSYLINLRSEWIQILTKILIKI